MAERSSQRKKITASVSQKPFGKKSEKIKTCETRSTPGSTTKHDDDMLAKEEHYKILNAELEAKTADLVRQTELLMKEKNEVLAKPLSTLQLTDLEDDDIIIMAPLQDSIQKPHVKVKTKQQTTLKSIHTGKQLKDKTSPGMSSVNYLEEAADTFLSKTIQNMEEKMDDEHSVKAEIPFSADTMAPGVSDAQIRVLKAKLRIMEEEMDHLTSEYYKKDDENIRLTAKMKELEEDRARLQKSESVLQAQIEKHKILFETSAKKCEGLQLHIAELNKEIENLNRSSKQAAALHNTVEIRLNRAMEESQKLKSELNKMKQMNKDKTVEEHQSKVSLLAENKNLKKQKAELIVGFKKQLKLIDILKRQKMHFEAAKLLSFTEEEFMKALDWGES
ncbi:testis-expressed protein 9 isoform X2 [Boleophthalmus pectinirostris]|uniref:testis-expressed protein 9 isoform X2 n=1 Tax=Boleophthalmus pectinirostris TaxID=150288 RepID=UPI00242C8DE1|nr:testis-expressed protein 9 isoform X2 [Boleophthalmus pectinirostris]